MLTELKKAFSRIETKIAVALALLFAFIGLLDIMSDIRGIFFLSGAQASMAYQGKWAEFFATFILPVIAVMPYSDCYYCERKYGVHIAAATRSGLKNYFYTKALAVIILSASIAALTYIFNQLLCLIAFPAERTRGVIFRAIYENPLAREFYVVPDKLLSMNHPFFRNALHALFACYYGAGVGLFGYSVSLFFQKNRVITNLIPVAVCYIWTFVATVIGDDYIPALGIEIGSLNQKINSYLPLALIILALYASSLLLIHIKTGFKRDLL